jgi:hypothetical protein
MICPECGRDLGNREPHRPGCSRRPPPAPDLCPHCDEPFTPEELAFARSIPHVGEAFAALRRYHLECSLRQVIGGLNHLQARCTCCGGTEPPDPPELSKREAAKAAFRYWRQHADEITSRPAAAARPRP